MGGGNKVLEVWGGAWKEEGLEVEGRFDIVLKNKTIYKKRNTLKREAG